MFKLQHQSATSQARVGSFTTNHGDIATPFFLPIATRAAVKGLTMAELKQLDAQIILANTYHLWLKPGREVIRSSGGLHKFMGWSGPILTDSGGFQVFSLAKVRRVKSEGVDFSVPQSGDKYFLTPKLALEIQADLGSDIAIVLDECIGYPATHEEAKTAVERTTAWAREAAEYWPKVSQSSQSLFGIIQGSIFEDLRRQSAQEITALPFAGYAIGGLAVGEEPSAMYQVLDYVVPLLPPDKLHYLMGVGYPENIVAAVKRGVDCFDCVIPSREARHGRVYLWQRGTDQERASALDESGNFYETLNLKSAAFTNDFSLLDESCSCFTCREQQATKAYLRHLFDTEDPLARRLATIHNLHFYLELMGRIRKAITANLL